MNEQSFSIVTGTAGLSLACIVALALTLLRLGISAEKVGEVRIFCGITLMIQLVHTVEEYNSQFYVKFPEMLGLQAWPKEFFVVFNLLCLSIWALAISGVKVFPRASAFPLWFLGIASIANGVIHPTISIATGEYFPGLWSSLFLGASGIVLVYWLVESTKKREYRIGTS